MSEIGSLIFFIVSIGIFVLTSLWFTVMLGLWTYEDAKVRSDNAALWTLIVLLTSLTGLIIYFLTRSKTEKSPGKYKTPLIASIVCFGLATVLYIAGIVTFAIYYT